MEASGRIDKLDNKNPLLALLTSSTPHSVTYLMARSKQSSLSSFTPLPTYASCATPTPPLLDYIQSCLF